MLTVPWLGSPSDTRVRTSPTSTSLSGPITVIGEDGVSSAVAAVRATPTGASLTGLTLTVTVPTAAPPSGSDTV